MTGRQLGPAALGLLAFVAACVLWLPGLGDGGLWSDVELPVFDRARASLGLALSGLERSPPLPDALRSASVRLLGASTFAIRLPHALSAAALVGLAAGWARARGASVMLAVAAGALASAFPMLSLGARTTVGDPIGELMLVLTVLSGRGASGATSSARRIALWLATAAAAALAIASLGLVVGLALPAVILALATDHHSPRQRAALAALALVSLAIGVRLCVEQADGYLPVLGAAKDLDLLDQPQDRRFAAGLEDFGYQVFPWAGLVLVGATLSVRQRLSRWPALWVVATMTIVAGWSSVYGPTPLPLTVPAALCGVAAIESLLDSQRAPWERRLVLFVVGAAAVLLAKDAELNPARILAPTELRAGEHLFPNDALEATDRLRLMGKFSLYAVVIGGVLGRRREGVGLERWAKHLPGPVRDTLIVGSFAAAALGGAAMHARVLLPRADEVYSPKTALDRYAAWASAGQLPPTLGVHRVRDPALALYGPDAQEALVSRRDLTQWFARDTPAVALIRESDLAAVVQASRQAKTPFFVLDDTHATLRLVANVLPEGAEDLNPLSAIVLDEAPALEHETLVEFDGYVEVIGWEIDAPLRRGKEHTLQIAMRVLRPLPGGSKLYARFLHGRLSRIAGEPHEFAEGLYPCNLWRKGDIILNRVRFETPPLEIVPGDYDLLIGLRRSQTKNFQIKVPETKNGPFGVQVRGSKREFAKIGTVEVW